MDDPSTSEDTAETADTPENATTETPAETGTTTPDTAPADTDTSTGDTEEEPFDRERALRTIATQRASETAAKKQAREDREAAETAAQRAETAEQRAATAEADLLRLTVATRKGLPETAAKRLIGSTLEELEADADELLSAITSPAQEGTRRRPKEATATGTLGLQEPEKTDPRTLAAGVKRSSY